MGWRFWRGSGTKFVCMRSSILMVTLQTSKLTAGYRAQCEDRVAVFTADERTVIVVADGAGGLGEGGAAAEAVIREVASEFERIHSADQWSAMLRQMDYRIGPGESTAVIVDVRPYGIAGASVGDSQAWIIEDGAKTDLTQNQIRKPLLGSGEATPISFGHPPLRGVLLAATDGLFNYAKPEAIIRIASQGDLLTIPKKCLEAVRLPSGDLWDDVGIVAARVSPPVRTRQRYSI
jgi:PPM family protein phosphatase